jgi:hypothetical protein
MNKLLPLLFCFFSLSSSAQTDTSKWLRAFPITNYVVDLSDSIKIVQVVLPQTTGVTLPDKQFGLLKGIYRDKHSDTMNIGAGRCYLIKGEYYYFSINIKQSGKLPREGDLLFTFVNKSSVYRGNIVKLASFYIGLESVYDIPLYNRYDIFSKWKKSDEDALIDSIVADIHFTANYFLTNNPDMNIKVKGGKYDGKMVLNTMQTCTKNDVIDFIEYMIARPRLYSGRNWKISEVFATWLSESAPTVIK